MNNKISSIFSILAGLFILLPSISGLADDRGDKLLEQVDKRMSKTSYETYFQIVNQLPNDKEIRMTAYSAKRQTGEAVVLIVTPPSLKGRAALRIGKEVWTHVPGETKLRKSTLRHAFVSGVFNNGDYLSTSFGADHRAEILKKDGKSYLLLLTPKKTDLPYHSMELLIDKKSMYPSRLTQYAAPGVVIKTVKYDYSRRSEDGKTTLTTLNTEAEANRLYRSAIAIGKVKERKFPDSTFTKEQLAKIGTVLK